MEEGVPPTPALSLAPADKRQLTSLMDDACKAAMAGDLETVQAALAEAGEQDEFNIDGHGHGARSPLYQACLGRQPHVVDWLLGRGAQDSSGDAYKSICATGEGSLQSADPTERAASLMRQAGFVGSPMNTKPKQTKGKPQREVPKGDGRQGKPKKTSPVQLMQAALDSLAAGETAPLVAPMQDGELPIHFATKKKDTEVR